jgi:hypothetical protein
MNIRCKGMAAIAALVLLCSNARADWVESSDPLVVKAMPSPNTVPAQNPPSFSWARFPAGWGPYQIEIASDDRSFVTTAVVNRNWYLPSAALPNGSYKWRVRPLQNGFWSNQRPFSIDSRSTKFEVPENAALRSRILSKSRPRMLPSSFVPMSNWSAGQKRDLEQYSSWMSSEFERQTQLPQLSDTRWPLQISAPLTAAMYDQQHDVIQRVEEVSRQMEISAVLWRLKGEYKYFREAVLRGDQLVALNPKGPTGFIGQDQATRQIALSLIKTVDLLARDLDADRKARWLSNVAARTTDIYNDLASTRRLDQYPLDSHGDTALGYLSLIATLSLGDIAAADAWFDFSFRGYVSSLSPWSGPEGGFSLGTAYAEYAAAGFVALWDPLMAATGVNLYAKPWSLGFLDFAMQFTPAGARKHAFGDGSETEPDSRVFRAFASRMTSPRAAWYADSLGGTEDTLTMLVAPYPLPVSGTMARIPPANSAYFPAIGWTAMHNDINSSQRVSVFFKSSPYGSFVHSHGDQNGLLLSVANQPLLIKAGWYDWWGSPYWTDWYHQTKSQNAITFDGGQGQKVDGYREQLQYNGKITSFAAKPTYDYAEGDATAAYGGKLTMAKRQVWYLRNVDAVLVRDKLAAPAPHTYEFNLHTPAPITVEDSSKVRIVANGQSLCVRSLFPQSVFRKLSGAPPKPGTYEDHGAFMLRNDGRSVAEFLVLLDVQCKRPVVTFGTSGNALTVKVGGQTVTLDDSPDGRADLRTRPAASNVNASRQPVR